MMCGFGGILTFDQNVDIGESLGGMLAAMQHRGPDGSGQKELQLPSGWRVGLAHTRLAILDPSAAGIQPMASHNRQLWTVFNGEIYNHKEIRASLGSDVYRTGTDTETLLSCWQQRGVAGIHDWDGMFALGLLDLAKQCFWLVRDRIGIKPAYVAQAAPHTWVFASEIRAVLASGLVERRINHRGLPEYLRMGHLNPPSTLAAGVESLVAGETMQFDLRTPSVTPVRNRYWKVPFNVDASLSPRRLRESLSTLSETFESAVSAQLVSDVPIGVFLSGGIDSAALVETLTRRGHELQTYSVSFEERNFDESELAAETAQQFGTSHHSVKLTPSTVLTELPVALRSYDSPSFDGLNTWFISRAVRATGVKVCLSGLGGDELFGGYGYHRVMRRLDNMAYRVLVRTGTSTLSLIGKGGIRCDKYYSAASADNLLDRYRALRTIMGEELIHQLVPDLIPVSGQFASNPRYEMAPHLDGVNSFSMLDMQFYMQNTLLRDADQMSMYHGLEVRVPLLSHRIVEPVARIPGKFKCPPHVHQPPKPLLLRLLKRKLPDRVVFRKKTGFVFPWGQWLRGELRSFLREELFNRDSIEACGMDVTRVLRLEEEFFRGKRHVRETDLLSLAALMSWVKNVILVKKVHRGVVSVGGH